jgi:hypothetical protein
MSYALGVARPILAVSPPAQPTPSPPPIGTPEPPRRHPPSTAELDRNLTKRPIWTEVPTRGHHRNLLVF